MRRHRSCLAMCLVPCSARNARSASSRRRPAVPAARRVLGLAGPQPGRPLHRLGQVRRAGAERVGEIVADDGGHAARPEQGADHDADRAAERHVLDPHHADLPSDRDEQVEQDRDHHRERRLTDGERRGARRVRGHEHRDRERDPQRGLVAADRHHRAPRRSRSRARCPRAPGARSRRSPAAFVRRTDSVPSTTQKPCWTVVTSAIGTATASATAPRRLLTNQTDRTLACVCGRCADVTLADGPRAARPIRGPALPRRTSGSRLEPLGVGEPATRSACRGRDHEHGDGERRGRGTRSGPARRKSSGRPRQSVRRITSRPGRWRSSSSTSGSCVAAARAANSRRVAPPLKPRAAQGRPGRVSLRSLRS